MRLISRIAYRDPVDESRVSGEPGGYQKLEKGYDRGIIRGTLAGERERERES